VNTIHIKRLICNIQGCDRFRAVLYQAESSIAVNDALVASVAWLLWWIFTWIACSLVPSTVCHVANYTNALKKEEWGSFMPLSINMIHFGPLCSWISLIMAVFLDYIIIIHNQTRTEGCNCKRKCNGFIWMDIVSL